MRVMLGIVILVLLAGSAAPCVALAEPRNGFGLAGGVTANEGRITFKDGTTASASSAGVSVTGDAQFTVNERWSLLPYLALSWEHSSGDLSGTSNNGGAGFEVRRWSGDFFLGGRIGYYVQLLSTETTNGTGYGPGGGVSVGLERPGSLTWSATFELFRAGVYGDHVSVRLHVGRRWE